MAGNFNGHVGQQQESFFDISENYIYIQYKE